MGERQVCSFDIQDVVHCLMVNGEAIKNPHSLVTLSFFLFRYAKNSSKNHYNSYAFDILRSRLYLLVRNEFDMSDKESIIIGHGILDFVRRGYFVSDELDDILTLFDKKAMNIIETNSTGCSGQKKQSTLVMAYSYLVDRLFSSNEVNQWDFVFDKVMTRLVEFLSGINSFLWENMVWIKMLKEVFESYSPDCLVKNDVGKVTFLLKGLDIERNMKEMLSLCRQRGETTLDVYLEFLFSLCSFYDDNSEFGIRSIQFRSTVADQIALDLNKIWHKTVGEESLLLERLALHVLIFTTDRANGANLLLHSLVNKFRDNAIDG